MEHVINTTPHEIVVWGTGDASDTVIARFPPARDAQLRMKTTPVVKLPPLNDVVPVVSAPAFVSFDGPVEDMLESTLIVSMPVGEFIRQNHDAPEFECMRVYGPDTGPDAVVRNDSGQIVGTGRLVLYKP